MSKSMKIALPIVVMLTAFSFYVFQILSGAGAFTELPENMDANCTIIDAVPGPEDILVDTERGIAYVSAYDRRKVAAGGPGSDAIRGGIYAIDLTKPRAEWRLTDVTPQSPADFRPHGIGFYVGPDGKRTLIAASHPSNGRQIIEVFDVLADGMLAHRTSIEDPLIRSPNDLVPVSHDAFYVGNDYGMDGELLRQLEAFASLDATDLIYWDGEKAVVADDGLTMANGVNVSADGKTLYVAETQDHTLRMYDRNIETGVLTLREKVELGTAVDNIDVREDGALLIGAHIRILDFLEHAGDVNIFAPSQVLLVVPGAEGTGGAVGTIYLNDGKELSASSVAAAYKDTMLVGAVFDPRILACDMPQSLPQ